MEARKQRTDHDGIRKGRTCLIVSGAVSDAGVRLNLKAVSHLYARNATAECEDGLGDLR